jgi:biopolymer transport protein ExbD
MRRISLALAGVIALLLAVFVALAADHGVRDPNNLPDLLVILGWILVSLLTAATFMLFRAAFQWDHNGRISARPRQMLPDVVLRNLAPLSEHRHVPLMMGMPDFGMCCLWILGVPVIVMLLLQMPAVPTGLRIRLPGPYPGAVQHSPQSETLGVYVMGHRGYYVNGQLVPREQLGAILQKELGRRVVWTVYLEADQDCAFGDVVYVMDTIKGLGAQVYWITPRVRDELNANPNP